MKLSLIRFYQKTDNYRWIIIAAAIVLFLISLLLVQKLDWEENILELLPEGDSEIEEARRIMDQFNPMDAMFIDVGFHPDSAGSEAELTGAADSLYRLLAASDYFSRITYRWTYNDLLATVNTLNRYRPALFSKRDSAIAAEKTTAAAIESRFAEFKQKLAESPAPFLSRQFRQDPLDFNALAMRRLNAMQSRQGNIQIHEGRLFTKNKRHILIIAYPQFSSADSRRSAALVYFMNQSIQKMQNAAGEKISVAYISGHRFSVENARRIKGDIQLTVTVSLIAISILSLLVYSRPLLMLLTLLPALFGTMLALALSRFFIPNISAIIIGSGAMLIGIAVDYGIHFLYHLDQAGKDETKAAIMSRITRPLILGAATTLLAFLTLQLSIMPAYQQLGKFVALGIGSALLFVIFVLPHLSSMRRKILTRKPILNLSGFYTSFFAMIRNNRIAVFTVIVLISALSFAGLFHLRIEGDIQKLNAVSGRIQQDWTRLLDVFGDAMSSTSVTVESENLQQALQKDEMLDSLLQQARHKGMISSFTSLAPILPSIEKQKRNINRWQRFFDEQKIDMIRDNLRRPAAKHEIRFEIFKPFLESLETKPEILTAEAIEGTILKDVLQSQLAMSDTSVTLLTMIKIGNGAKFEQLKKYLKNAMPDISVYNGQHFVSRMVLVIFQELKRIAIIALIVIFTILLIYKRRLFPTLMIMLPLIISLFWTFGIMGWLGIKINIINSLVSVFIFGLVVDYCIFLVSGFSLGGKERERYLLRSGSAITISALTTMFGLGALILARHPALFSLGVTALLGIAGGLMAVLLIIPASYLSRRDESEKK